MSNILLLENPKVGGTTFIKSEQSPIFIPDHKIILSEQKLILLDDYNLITNAKQEGKYIYE